MSLAPTKTSKSVIFFQGKGPEKLDSSKWYYVHTQISGLYTALEFRYQYCLSEGVYRATKTSREYERPRHVSRLKARPRRGDIDSENTYRWGSILQLLVHHHGPHRRRPMPSSCNSNLKGCRPTAGAILPASI